MKYKNQAGWHKYTTIIIAIILLLIITLAIIGLAYYNTQRAGENSSRINAAARLSTFTQDIKNNVYNINIYAKEITLARMASDNSANIATLLQNIEVEETNLERAAETFDTTLQVFLHGGTLRSESGSVVNITPLTDTENLKLLQAIDEIWQPYQRLIHNFGNSLSKNRLNTDAINFATDYARIFNDRLSALSERITDNLTAKASVQSRSAQIYLIVAFITAVLIATYLIFIAVHQLVQSDRALARSQRELDDIMDTITEGLFLIDKNLNVGEQHSAELEHILNTHNIANQRFTDLLKGRVSDKDIDLTEGFLEQIFKKSVYDDLIEALNPLSKIKIISDSDTQLGGKKTTYLSFNFHRVFENKEITNVLVSVRDITENVLLERRLEQERIENEARMEMLSTILQVDTDLMQDFLAHVQESGRSVNAILKTSGSKPAVLKNKLRQISRTIHGIKGEASALSLDSFTKQLEKIEDDIAAINQKSSPTGNDFLGLTVRLDELLTMNDKARHLFDRLAAGRINAADLEESTPERGMTQYLSNFAAQIAERNDGKQVALDCTGLGLEGLSDKQTANIREMSLQLLRNAIVHGIETPLQRTQVGKDSKGHITIQLAKSDDGYWRYSFNDDGAGINFGALRKLAQNHPQYKDRDPQSLSHNELIRFMFGSGTSTAQTPNEDAGRGVGMDVIREAIKQLNGKLQIHSEAGQFTRFTIKFPA